MAKGKKHASFLSSLSNTRWGVTPRLFRILLSSTVHAATDYAAAAWINLPIPKFFAEQLSAVDAICATRALGALRNTPHLFLRHDFNLLPPYIRLTAKILSTVAFIAAKPPSHPLYHFYAHAQTTKPTAHKGPLHAFFQSAYAGTFCRFLNIQQPDPTIPLTPTPTFGTLIQPEKDRAVKAIKALKPGLSQVIVYSDGSRIDGKNTAAAAWCENTKHLRTHQLGKAEEYGIFEAEFIGFILALHRPHHPSNHGNS